MVSCVQCHEPGAQEVRLRKDVKAVCAGCTEVPLILTDGDCPAPVIDPTWVLAQAAVQRALETPVRLRSSQRCYKDRG